MALPPPLLAAVQEPKTENGPREFVLSNQSVFEWWVDADSGKVNFRRCDQEKDGRWNCMAPMLLRGLDQKDVPALLDYYSERLAQSGNSRLTQFVKVLSGSFGTATVYIGAITTMGILKNAVPSSWTTLLSTPIRGGIHIVSIGTLALLMYFTANNFMHLHRQEQILSLFHRALETHPQVPPYLQLQSRELFEEFMTTFRRTLYEFTHGGVNFEDGGNMIFQ